MMTDERRAEFYEAVADQKIKTGTSRGDSVARIVGILAMVAGLVGVFVAYNASLSQDDTRDIASGQIQAIAFLALTIIGAAVYVVAGLARVLRVWLLRQLLEGQAQADQLAAVVASRN